MHASRLRLVSAVEWIAAAIAVYLLLWALSQPLGRMLDPNARTAAQASDRHWPPGVPSSALSVPLMLLIDGTEIRLGTLRAQLEPLLTDEAAASSMHASRGEFGDRHTRAYLIEGRRVYITCERDEPGGPMKVTGIHLPRS